MKEPKGIKLEGNLEERLQRVVKYIKELGGKGTRRHRNHFSGQLETRFTGHRQGECHPHDRKDRETWDEQGCFGSRSVPDQNYYGSTNEEYRIHMRAKGQYEIVEHYTLVNCKKECFHKAIVVCVRTMATSSEEYMTTHVAGKCPYCNYFLRY
jgi:hypothetical protein